MTNEIQSPPHLGDMCIVKTHFTNRLADMATDRATAAALADQAVPVQEWQRRTSEVALETAEAEMKNPANGHAVFKRRKEPEIVVRAAYTQEERQADARDFARELYDLLCLFRNRSVEPKLVEKQIHDDMNGKLNMTLADMSPSARVCVGPLMASLHLRLENEAIKLTDALTSALATYDSINQLVQSNKKRATFDEMSDKENK